MVKSCKKVVINGQKWSKVVEKWSNNGQKIVEKWSKNGQKMVKSGQKWSKIFQK